MYLSLKKIFPNTAYRYLGFVSVIVLGVVSILGSGGGGSSTPAVTLTGITVSPAAVPEGLPIDVTQQFTATGSYSDNSKKDLTKSVAWNSSATGMATIDANGLATGVATGASNITASSSGKTSNVVSINVINPTLLSLVVTPTAVPNRLPAGRTQSFKAEGAFNNNKTYDVTNFVTWNSSNMAAATIAATGVATGVAIGTTNITASTTTPAVTSNTVVLEVVIPTATAVIIEPQTFDVLPVNRKQQFKALLKFSDDSLVDITNSSTWSSNDAAIASVIALPSNGPLGQVTGVAAGSATITVNDNNSGLSNSVDMTVNTATITAVNVIPSNPNNLPAGFTQDFTASGTFSDGKTRNLTDGVAWAVSDNTVATFENPGATVTVKGLKPGSVDVKYIDVLADGKLSETEGTAPLTVTSAILQSIAINPNVNFQIPAGGQTFFTAIGTYSDASGRDITSEVIWESADTSVVVFGPEGGKLTALASGVGNNANVLAKAENTANPPVVISSSAVNVSVVAQTLQTLTMNPQPGAVDVGETKQFTVTGTFSGGATSSYTERVTWTSADPAIATISNDYGTKGQGTGVAAGIVTITATDPETSISTNLSITVSQP